MEYADLGAMNVLNTPLDAIEELEPRVVKALARDFDVATIGDALLFLPFRYVDRRYYYPVSAIAGPAPNLQVVGVLHRIQQIPTKNRKTRLEGQLIEGNRSIELVWFRGVQWVYKHLQIGAKYIAYGEVKVYGNRLQMVHPELTLYTENQMQKAGIEGVYHISDRMRRERIDGKKLSHFIKALLQIALPEIQDPIPDELLRHLGLCPLPWALEQAHKPQTPEHAEIAKKRLKLDELFFLQLSLLHSRMAQRIKNAGPPFKVVGELFNKLYREELPFDLTGAQKRVLREMRADTGSGRQMNRLLQGDVGSGKTLVALFMMLLATDNGYQSCLMAPTEILAQQHYATIKKFVRNLNARVELLTGSTKQKERRAIHEGLQDGTASILVGTHALIEDEVQFKTLGLVIVDEQHRFGVEQRAKLWAKGSEYVPHILVMTATPIPRTLSMTLYGDLDVSVLDELPPGRKPVITKHIYEANRAQAWGLIEAQLQMGHQAYVVYPLIEESEELDLASLEEGYVALSEYFSPRGYTLAMLHGRMSPEEKQSAMELFASGKANILVATTVIEVGVDVPNATIMLIESAQRFGLSQLHQLRGRVGRGGNESFCILLSGYELAANTRTRLATMVETNDGFQIAEVDLKLRGPGDAGGTQQSGVGLQLKVADLSTDFGLLLKAREVASRVIEYDNDLSRPEHRLMKEAVEREAEKRSKYNQVG